MPAQAIALSMMSHRTSIEPPIQHGSSAKLSFRIETTVSKFSLYLPDRRSTRFDCASPLLAVANCICGRLSRSFPQSTTVKRLSQGVWLAVLFDSQNSQSLKLAIEVTVTIIAAEA